MWPDSCLKISLHPSPLPPPTGGQGQAGANNKNSPQSPFCLSLTGKGLQRGRLLLPFVAGQEGLWPGGQREGGRDLRVIFFVVLYGRYDTPEQ